MDKKVADYAPRPLAECSDLELFNAVLNYTGEAVKERGYNTGKKKLYYISAEFLIGKLLSNNLINLGLYDTVKKELSDAGKDITELEEFESEPSLGNGGLGRLAACFIDSLATLGYPADGVGLAYHCGLFRQTFRNNKQSETPDRWLHWGQESWMHRTDKHYTVDFGGFSINSVMYEIDVTGYGSKCGKLRLFDTDTIDERVIRDQIDFDKTKIAKNLTLFLYPDDSDDAGRILRVYQEYFMCANAAQLILEEAKAKGSNLHDLYDYAAVQINDTHPTMVIPELIRRLEAEGIEEEEAIEIVRKVCGYTNHTILAEALETWPESYLEKAVPQLMPVIHSLADYVEKKYDEPFVQIIDKDDRVHMANIDIHFSHSINGVAKLHTEILKNTELKPFYDIYPEKFNNKTNGITFRRWGVMCDPELTEAINGVIGDAWIKDASHLAELRKEENDPAFLKKVLAIKGDNKKNFAAHLKKNRDIEVNPDSVFDVQCKRLHEYKRQQLNLLWAISRYQEIKAGKKPVRPITMFFGAKAAPAYTIAKDIIHAILCFASIVDNDPEVSPYLKVVMLENYNVSLAEKLIPAADISEQISLASKEASGTSNMKFMLNGAVTLGTMDGANVEIADLVGKDNIYTFGESSDEVIKHYKKADYVSRDYYEKDPVLKDAVDFLVSDEMLEAGDEKNLKRLYNELLNKDWFMTFPDFEDYCKTKEVMLRDYEDRDSWSRKMLVNIAQAGFFSSDRTIEQYNTDIWHLKRDETK
ncbi:MAG: glycogen/starch/alpha-glucan phosphorylase [Erysipelotrichaceae bacterium]|jgi:starch phosphorylase